MELGLNLNVGGHEEGLGERWIMHYRSSHQILIVGDGDFSFSACLATAFGSAANITATSLDSKDDVIKKYKRGKSNLDRLRKSGAYLLHGVDAMTNMKLRSSCFRIRRFDRIIFNFPHAGFHGREDGSRAIRMHRALILGFFKNASGMLRADGEIHINHKTNAPFCHWNLEELAYQNSLTLFKCADFKIEDYPGYNNKRGAGSRCDESFPLGKCSTFMFILISPAAKRFGSTTTYGYDLINQLDQVIEPPPPRDVSRRQLKSVVIAQPRPLIKSRYTNDELHPMPESVPLELLVQARTRRSKC